MAEKPNDNVVPNVTKAMIKANSGHDKNETALMMMSSNMDWGEFLTPAPLSIALLGQLMLVAGEKDFSLESSKPKDGFKFIQHPQSFRACLVQVGNTGWRAFNEAHKNMDAIRLYSARVPDQVKNVVRILVSGSDEAVKAFLPIEFGKIDRNASECLRLAEAVEAKFERVMDLTGELLEVSSAAKGYYEKTQEEEKLQREVALQKKESAEKKINLVKEQQEKLEKEVKDAKAAWENAVDSMPSNWYFFGMQVVETLTNAASNSAASLVTQLAKGGMMKGWKPSPTGSPMPEQTPAAVPTVPDYVNGDRLDVLVSALVEAISSKEPFKDGDCNEESVAKKLQTTRIEMANLQEDWSSKVKSPHNEEALKLLNKGLEICTKGVQMMDQLNVSGDNIKAIAKQASNLKEKVKKFCTKAKAKTGANPFYTKPPRQALYMTAPGNRTSSSAANSAVESARYKIAEARNLLEKKENRYDQTCKEMTQSNEELSKVLQSLAQHSEGKIANFENIRETLIKGIKALASVREQWQKLVKFFQFITNIIKVCQKESLDSFNKYAAEVGKKRVLANGYADTDFMRDLIYEQVSQASTTSYVVWSISKTYVEISRNHLMNNLASLGHLIALDPEKDRPTIEAKRNELMNSAKEAQDAIGKCVSEAKDHFQEKVTKRIKQIETELLKALPSEDPAKIKEINDSVKSAVKEADDELGADNF